MRRYTYKFRLYPTKEQQILLDKHFGCSRWVYNHFLNLRNEYYLKSKLEGKKKYLGYQHDSKELTKLRNSEDTRWLSEVGAQVLQQTLKNLDGSFGNFSKRGAGFPKFKKKNGKNSFRVPQHIKIRGNKIHIVKFSEGIIFDNHREIIGKVKNVTVRKVPSGKYFISVLVEQDNVFLPKNECVVGVDLGICNLATLSDGSKFDNIRSYKKLEERAKLLHKNFSRAKVGSKGKEKCRKKLAKLYEKITNIRSNHIHQTSRKIVNENQVIILETLGVQDMMKDRRVSKCLADCSLGRLVECIKYKGEWAGRTVKQINRWYPSSKTCSECSYINEKLNLCSRTWECPRCLTVHDRDLNAAQNILQQGLNDLNRQDDGVSRLPQCKTLVK